MSEVSLPHEREIEQNDILSEVTEDETEPGSATLQRVRFLWEHRRFLARIAVIAFVLSAVLALLIPKEYQSTARLMPPDDSRESGAAMIAALTGRAGMGSLGSSLLGMKSPGAVFVAILKSRTIADRLSQRFDLAHVYGISLEADVRRKLDANSSIAEDLKTGVITITVTDRSPIRAARLTQAYITQLDGLVSELSTSSAHRERVFLEERLKSVKAELDVDAKKLSDFSSKNTTLDIKEQAKSMMDTSAVLAGQLIAAESELRGLQQIYADNNVRVRTVQARITELRRQLIAIGGSGMSSGNSGRKDEGLPYPTLKELPALGVTYADLYRQVKTQETVFEMLTQEYELAKLQEAKELPSVKVLDAPEIPERKSFPPRASIVVLMTMLSVFAGCVYIWMRAQWYQMSSTDPRKRLLMEIYTATIAVFVKRFRFRLRAM